MKRAAKIVLWVMLAGAGCLGSYQPPNGTGSGSKKPGSSTGGSTPVGGSPGGGSSGGGSSSGGNPSASVDLGSSTTAPADMAGGMVTPVPDAGVDSGTPTSTTPSCDALVACCMGDAQCAAQFTNLSENVCAGLLAGFQAQGACL